MKLSRASAAIIFNEGNPGRTGVLKSGTENIPVIFTSYAVGTQLLACVIHGDHQLVGPTGV